MTRIAATSVAPAYVGPDPEHCLAVAGLQNVRPAPEAGVWVANLAGTPSGDTVAMVFVSGPYASQQQAVTYAQSLRAVPELATPGGRWVASAAVTSKLDFQVNAVAACMAGAG